MQIVKVLLLLLLVLLVIIAHTVAAYRSRMPCRRRGGGGAGAAEPAAAAAAAAVEPPPAAEPAAGELLPTKIPRMKVATGIYDTSTHTINLDIDSVAEDKRLCIDEVYELIKTIPEWACLECQEQQRGGIVCYKCNTPRQSIPALYNLRDTFAWQTCERLANELLLDACAGRSQNIDDSIKTLIETPYDELVEMFKLRSELAKTIMGGTKTSDELVAGAKILFEPIAIPLAAVLNIKIPLITAFDTPPKLKYNDFIFRKSSVQNLLTNGVTVVASIITSDVMLNLLKDIGCIRYLDISGIGVCMLGMKHSLKIEQNVFQLTGWERPMRSSFADLLFYLRAAPKFNPQKDTLRYIPATATAAAALIEPGESNTFKQERSKQYGEIPAPQNAQLPRIVQPPPQNAQLLRIAQPPQITRPPQIAHPPPQKEKSSCTLM